MSNVKTGKKKMDDAGRKASSCSKSTENDSTQVRKRGVSIENKPRKSSILIAPNKISENEDTLPFLEDEDERIFDPSSDAKKMKYNVGKENVERKMSEYKSNLRIKEEPISTPETLAEDTEHSNESSKSGSSNSTEELNPTAEKYPSQESEMLWESPPFDSFEDDAHKKAWTMIKEHFVGKLKRTLPSNVMSLYNASEECKIKEMKAICVQALKSTLSTFNFYDVLSFADSKNEAALTADSLTFICKNLEEIQDTEKWKNFHREDPNKAEELLSRVCIACRDKKSE